MQQWPPAPEVVPGSVIAAGDVVDVRVFGQEAMSARGRVRPDGTLTLPLLGVVPVAGWKPDELARALKQRLVPYVNSPEVTVVIQESQVAVAVIGEVKQAGIIELPAPANVLHALARSGGLSDYADASSIYVLRPVASGTARIRFRYDWLIDGDPAALRFHLKNGDTIVVE